MGVSAMIYVQVPQTTTVSDWRRWRGDFCGQFSDFSRHSETLMPDFHIQDEPRIFHEEWKSIWDIFPTSIFLGIYYGMGEYYGPGYERGYLPKFANYADWLDTNILEGHIWYGDDSGDTVGAFNKISRELLINYWNNYKHAPYDAKHEEKSLWENIQNECESSWAEETSKYLKEIETRYGIQ